MKLTTTQLRRIIREEVESMTQAPRRAPGRHVAKPAASSDAAFYNFVDQLIEDAEAQGNDVSDLSMRRDEIVERMKDMATDLVADIVNGVA
jgi:hypothetical protein